jgi:hypothetical protein
MNDTADYRMNPAEDTLLRGDQLAEGMWVLAESTAYRVPVGASEDDRIRAQRFRQVSGLHRKPPALFEGAPERIAFTGTWIDGYQRTHHASVDVEWIVKKAPVDPEATAEAQVIARICTNGYNEHVRLHGPDGDKAVESGTDDQARFTVEREGHLYDVTVTPRAEAGS